MGERPPVIPYQPLKQGRWRCLARPIALALSVVLGVVPAWVAVRAWITHFAWLRNGGYAQNSFPMGAFAREMTWVAVGCILLVAAGWLVAWGWSRRKEK